MATYYAITTINAQHGWEVVCSGSDKAVVRELAEREICGDQWDHVKDIYVQTKLKNLAVLSKTDMQRRQPATLRNWQNLPRY